MLAFFLALFATACKKENSTLLDPTQKPSGQIQSLGAVPDDPSIIAKVHLIMSPDFAAASMKNAEIQKAILERKIAPGGGGTTGDTKAPTVSISSPTTGTTFSNTNAISVSVSASDNVGVTSVSLYIDNILVQTFTGSPYNYNWSAPSANTHTLYAIAKDAANNSSTSASVQVTVNTTVIQPPPTLPLTVDNKMPPVGYQGS